MSYIFSSTKLKKIEIFYFRESNKIKGTYLFMFSDRENIDLGKFYTGNAKNISHMFDNRNLLKSLDLSNFETKIH